MESSLPIFQGNVGEAFRLQELRVKTAFCERDLINALTDESVDDKKKKEVLSIIIPGLGDNPLRPLHCDCGICLGEKQTKTKPIGKIIKASYNVMFRVDIYGSKQIRNFGDNRYLMTLILARQRYKSVHLLKTQSELKEKCHNFIARTKR